MLGVKVKDAGLWLPRFITQVEKLEGDINRIVAFYGKSRDASYCYLNHWRNTSKLNIELYADPYLPEVERHGWTLARIKKEIQQLLREGKEEYYLNLDCDLVGLPVDLVPKLMETDKDIIAGMTWTEGRPIPTFFDIYVYRKEGCMFHPYHPPGVGETEPFPVDSVSTCYLAKREVELAGKYSNPYPHIPFCRTLKDQGYQVWVHPQVHAIHVDLEKYGIMHNPQPIPLSMVPYITNVGSKLSAAQVGAERFLNDVLHYTFRFSKMNPDGYKSVQSFLDSRPLITASYKVLNESEFLEYSLKSVYPYVDRIDIVEGAVKHAMHGANINGSSKDDTVEIIKSFPDPNNKIKLIQGKWDHKEEMQTKLLELCSSKWMLFIDGDEIIDPDSMKLVRVFAEHFQDGSKVYARPEKFINFWHDFKHVAYSVNPVSPWYLHGLPHPFLIHRDVHGLNFAGFHTMPMDGLGHPIAFDDPAYQGRQSVLDGVKVYHFGNAKSHRNMYNKLLFEVKRGQGAKAMVERGKQPEKSVEEDMWFSGSMPPDFIIERFKKELPQLLKDHPRRDEKLIRITRKKPVYKFKRLE